MTTVFNTQELARAVRAVANMLPNKTLLPAETTMYFRPGAVENTVELGAGYGPRGVRTILSYTGTPLTEVQPVHAKALAACTRNLPGEQTTLEFTEKQLNITSGPANSTLNLMQVEVPPGSTRQTVLDERVAAYTPKLHHQGTVNGQALIEALKAVAWVRTEESDPTMESVKLTFTDSNIEISALSPYAMGKTSINYTPELEGVNNGLIVLLPVESCRALLTELPAADSVNLHWDHVNPDKGENTPTRVAFSTSNLWLCLGTSPVPAALPDYDQLYETTGEVAVLTLQQPELSNVVTRARSAIGATGKDTVRFTGTGITVSITANGDYQHQETLTTHMVGAHTDSACSERYLTSVLRSLGGTQVNMHWVPTGTGPKGRIILSANRDPNLQFVIPMQTTNN